MVMPQNMKNKKYSMFMCVYVGSLHAVRRGITLKHNISAGNLLNEILSWSCFLLLNDVMLVQIKAIID